jgi:succinate dehydrogenase / fumarate reductase cytochrome b subunit
MIVSGLWLLAFLVIHVKAFHDGWGTEYPWRGGGRDLYRQEMETFANPFMTAFYVVTMVVVGSHLWHGFSSAFQSLGVDHPTITPKLLVAGKVFAVFVAGAFIVIAAWAYLTQGGRVHA